MESQQELPTEEVELDKFLIVFEGSSPEAASHAKRLWSSVSLLPPPESRLVTADVRQRLPVARPRTSCSPAIPPGPSGLPPPRHQEEDRRRYLALANRREEVLALLRKQREQRIHKELVSRAHKPKREDGGPTGQKPSQDLEVDKDLVRALQ
ncbi:cilia- and flagella-associated protein HOATZ [Lampris incognitus]|uniref:cilia- and flagella-associated protein HOATZ n=1 Tax=Lampris incognitus TaxID=2546036 RepID=UPI0024B50776|nr:cilia- and flagella-associated protein HOATZ [Lampris incognitus]